MQFLVTVRTLDGGFHQYLRKFASGWDAYEWAQQRFQIANIIVRPV